MIGKNGRSRSRGASNKLEDLEASISGYKYMSILTDIITADVPEIYMQEFWATAIVHHHSIHFKMNNKKHIVNLEYFREMLQICPKLPDQQFEELPFEEEILTFLKDLGHNGEIKSIVLSQLKTFCVMYHKKNVDYAYLLWEDFVYQVENKNVKRSNEMYYPRFTKVIVNFFMTKDSLIPRRNRVDWHFSRDDLMFTTIKVVSSHEDTQLYGAILPDELTNEAIKDSESYKEYYAIDLGAEPPKTKASVKKNFGTDEGTSDKPWVPDLPTYASDDEQIFWKSSDEDDDDDDADNQDGDDNDDDDQNDDNDDDDDDGQDHEGQDNDNEQTDSNNDGDDFVHPKFSTHDEEYNEEEGSDLSIQTPSHYESTDYEESNEGYLMLLKLMLRKELDE
ncbi:uncharacterized mitochondrial protein-like protein [Tanacetum coccineum]